MSNSPKFIVVVGTSAGGIRALEELILQLKPEMNAAFFIVLHLSRKGIGNLLFQRLQQLTPLTCKVAENGEAIKRSVIYLAPPDEHLLLTKGQVVIGKGAHENRWRPSINNLFRSAAATYNSSVIGIILTGLLDDGTSGMSAVKRCGGITIVQDPNEADYPDMPLSVLDNVEVAHIESLSGMGILLAEIIAHNEPVEAPVPHDVLVESQLDSRVSTRIDNINEFPKSEFNCPECGGGLWVTQEKNPTHYRCHVGHSFTDRELLIRLSEALESTFWSSLRMMEERKTLLLKLSKKDQERGYGSIVKRNQERIEELEVHINNLKQLLFNSVDVDRDM